MSRRRAGPTIRDVIAERVFQRADGRRSARWSGAPARRRTGGGCEFQILGVGHNKVYDPGGVDSLQALQMALGMMAIQLEAYQAEPGLTLDDSYLALMKARFRCDEERA
jgi:hypothetical protein